MALASSLIADSDIHARRNSKVIKKGHCRRGRDERWNNLLSRLGCAQPVLPAAQLVLLPLPLAYLLLRRRGHALPASLWLHDSLLCSLWALPAVMLLIGLLLVRLANSNTDAGKSLSRQRLSGLAAPGVLPWYCAAGMWWGCSGWRWFVGTGRPVPRFEPTSGQRSRTAGVAGSVALCRRLPTPFSTRSAQTPVFLPGRLKQRTLQAMAAILPARDHAHTQGHTRLRFWKCFSAVLLVGTRSRSAQERWRAPAEHCVATSGTSSPGERLLQGVMARCRLLLQSASSLAILFGKHSLRRRVLLPMGAVSRRQPDWLWAS